MYKLKKVVSLILVVCVALFIFTACGNNSAATESSASTDAAATTAAGSIAADSVAQSTVPADPYEITWIYIGSGPQKDNEAVEQEINKYLKDKINATVKLVCYDWSTFDQKTSAMMVSGEPFDIIFTASWKGYQVSAAKGAFAALNDPSNNLFDKYMPKTKELLGEDFLAGSQINGFNYGVPVNKEKAHQFGFLLNKALVDKYKMDINTINKPADIEPMLKTIKENEKDILPIAISDANSFTRFCDWDKVNGNEFVPGVMYPDGRDTKVINQFESPEQREMYDLTRKFFLAGYIEKSVLTNNTLPTRTKEGTCFAQILQLKPGKDKEMSNDKVTWVQKAVTPVYMANMDTAGSMQAISKTSANPERVAMFLELVNTDKTLNNLINYGIEGKHYTKVSDNVIELTKDSGYNPQMQWAFGNQMINYLLPNEDPNKWEDFKKFNDQAKPMQSLGFMFDPSELKTEYAACTSVSDEFNKALDVGLVDPAETLPKYVAKLKDAGGDKIIAAVQKSFDEWKAKQGK